MTRALAANSHFPLSAPTFTTSSWDRRLNCLCSYASLLAARCALASKSGGLAVMIYPERVGWIIML